MKEHPYELPEGSPAWFHQEMTWIRDNHASGSETAIAAVNDLIGRTLFIRGFAPGLEVMAEILGTNQPSDTTLAAQAVTAAYTNGDNTGDPA